MKPSQRIGEIFDKLLKTAPNLEQRILNGEQVQWRVEIAAIKEYLDEEYVKHVESLEDNSKYI